MAKYQYNALKGNKQIVKGEVEAENYREAREKIRQLGFVPTKVYIEDGADNQFVSGYESNEIPATNEKIKFLSLQEKITFTSELEVLLTAGIPILEALHSLEENVNNQKLKVVCKTLRECIMSGKTFAQALKECFYETFGAVYIALVFAGESSGDLEATLGRILVLLRKQDKIKGHIISASIYPCVLLSIMFGVLVLFTKVIFPAFYGVIQSFGGQIPLSSMILISICQFVGNFWWLLLIGIVAFVYALVTCFKNSEIKRKWDEFILKVPKVSDFIRYINLSNFITVLYISYEAGVPLLSGLELANKTVGNSVIKRQVSNSVVYAKNGKSLTEAFEVSGVLPSALKTMVATGEKSGSLGKMLHDAADVIDKKVEMTLDTLTKLFEPTVIVIMGVGVLFILIAFYQLYFGMLGSLF